MTLSLLLGPTNTPLCSIIVFPTRKPRPGAGMQLSHVARAPRAIAAVCPLGGARWTTFSRKFVLAHRCAFRRPTGAPEVAQSRPWDAQGHQNEAPKLTFGRPGAPLLVKIRDSGPLTKTSLGTMFSSHLAGPGASIFTHFHSRNYLRDAVGSRSHLFLSFCGPGHANVYPRGATREPKVAQRRPKASPGTLKNQ